MTKHTISRTVFIVLAVLCLTQAAYYYPLLPDTVASHFGRSGKPDAWSSKLFFVNFYLITIGIIVILFPGIGSGMSKMPDSLINLPNKDYWLSPERRQETSESLSQYFYWFGSATLLLMLDIFHQSFLVHLGKAKSLDHPMLSVVTYVDFSVLWSIGLIAKFMKK
jgi:uncharacterized membrane protein